VIEVSRHPTNRATNTNDQRTGHRQKRGVSGASLKFDPLGIGSKAEGSAHLRSAIQIV
jgi:hypothetical protein